MSLKKRRQIAAEKAEVDAQRAEIKEAFKKHKIEQEFGKIASEALFKPITKRLPEIPEEPEETEEEKERKKKEEEEKERKKKGEEEGLDYGMDEFDLQNPFDENFKPDEKTEDEDDDEDAEEPMEGEWEESKEEEWEESKEEEREEPTAPNLKKLEGDDLRNINSMLSKSEGKENYIVQRGKFKGLTRHQLFMKGAEIMERRKEKLPERYLEHFRALQEEQEGRGFADPNDLVNQLYISIQGTKAGNNSQKLRKQIKEILSRLVSQGVLIKKQATEIFSTL